MRRRRGVAVRCGAWSRPWSTNVSASASVSVPSAPATRLARLRLRSRSPSAGAAARQSGPSRQATLGYVGPGDLWRPGDARQDNQHHNTTWTPIFTTQ